MKYNFDTDDEQKGRAALLLYAMYRSRNENSQLNGKDTWNRFGALMRNAVMKSETTAEFVQQFCHDAKIDSIRPGELTTGPVKLPGGELVEMDGVKDYKTYILDDNSLLELYERIPLVLIMLVRERIQREKLEGEKND